MCVCVGGGLNREGVGHITHYDHQKGGLIELLRYLPNAHINYGEKTGCVAAPNVRPNQNNLHVHYFHWSHEAIDLSNTNSYMYACHT